MWPLDVCRPYVKGRGDVGQPRKILNDVLMSDALQA